MNGIVATNSINASTIAPASHVAEAPPAAGASAPKRRQIATPGGPVIAKTSLSNAHRTADIETEGHRSQRF
eukprot:Skav224842  [mRNA]  locus=scaffold3408:321318:321530:+ [translate_table: standard]